MSAVDSAPRRDLAGDANNRPYDYGQTVRQQAMDGGDETTRPEPTTDEPTRNDATGDEATGIAGFFKRRTRAFDRWQRQHAPVSVPLAVVKKFGEDGAGDLAALVAYYSFLSLFPLLLVFITLLGFILGANPDAQRGVLDSALAQFPVVGDQLRENVTSVRGSGLALVIGVVLAVWAGMGATLAMQNAMNSIWRVPHRKRSGFLGMRLRSLGVLAIIATFVLSSFALSSFATAADGLGILGRVLTLVAAFAVNVAMFLVSFRLLTDQKSRWRDHLPGASLAAVFQLVLQSFGTAYVQHTVSGASQTYGAFAMVLGLIAYLYLQAQLVLYAAELNTVIALGLWPRGLDADDLTRADEEALEQKARVEERVPKERVGIDLSADEDRAEADARENEETEPVA